MRPPRWLVTRPRRFLRRTVLATCAVFMVGGLFAPPAQAITVSEQIALVDREVADVNFFWTMFNSRGQAPFNEFDWSTDLCSWSPDQPLGFDFRDACRRHDFGYRNYKRLGAFNETVRLRVDNAFLAHMQVICAGHNAFVRPACNGAASLYYNAVRQFGAS